MKDSFESSKKATNSSKGIETGGTIVGFMLFLSGAMLMIFGLLDVIVRIESLETAIYLMAGFMMYKVGKMLLKHFAVFKLQPERRRALQR